MPLGMEAINRPFTSRLFAGFKFRRRTITNDPTGGEGNCPHLVEAIPCDDPSCFTWQLIKLEECIPEEEMDCGEGTQIPQVRCVNSEGIKRIWVTIINTGYLCKSVLDIWIWICVDSDGIGISVVVLDSWTNHYFKPVTGREQELNWIEL